MAKTRISEFDIDPANNTDINSINIAEGCAPSGINNAIRQLMSDLKEFQTGAGGDSITATGVYSDTIGEKTSAAGVTVDGVLIKDNAVTASGGFSGALNGDVGGTTPAAGAFTTLSASGAFSANGGATLGDASGDALTINSSAVSIPNGLNFDSNTLVIDATNNNIGIGTASFSYSSAGRGLLEINGSSNALCAFKVGNTAYGYLASSASVFELAAVGASQPLTFTTNSSERMRITSTGNVGIGTSSPQAYGAGYTALTIDASTSPIIDLRVGGTRYGHIAATSSAFSLDTWGGSIPITFSIATSEKMRLDSSGNLGLGVTPSASTIATIQSTYGALTGNSQVNIAANAYYNAGWKYYATGVQATRYSQLTTGAHVWDVAPSGTAGNAITFTQAMTLDASGNLGLGQTSPVVVFDLKGTQSTSGALTYSQRITSTQAYNASPLAGIAFSNIYTAGGTAVALSGIAGGKENATDGNYASYVGLYTRANGGSITERMRIDSSGNLLVGTTDTPTTAAKVIAMGNATAPTASITGGILYVEGGALKFRGSSGTVTTIAPA